MHSAGYYRKINSFTVTQASQVFPKSSLVSALCCSDGSCDLYWAGVGGNREFSPAGREIGQRGGEDRGVGQHSGAHVEREEACESCGALL